jgi:hypothetical protein
MAEGEGEGWTMLAIVAAIVFAAAGITPTSSNRSLGEILGTMGNPGTTTPTTAVRGSNIPTGTLVSCPGFIVGQRTASSLTLRVYYSPENGGTNCVSGTHNGSIGSTDYVRTEIRLSRYSGSSWPSYATATGGYGQETVTGAYITNTDNLCVSANVTYFPAGGASRSVSMRRFACR